MMEILTDPQELASYTQGFFGEDGPYPVRTPGEEARHRLEQGLIQPGGTLLPQGDARADQLNYAMAQQAGFQRPQMQQPLPGGGASPQDVWAQFQQMMQTRPQDAHLLLSQATPDQIRAKVLFMEG
jgi:hypothetical protein